MPCSSATSSASSSRCRSMRSRRANMTRAPADERDVAPLVERLPGRGHGGVHVGRLGQRHLGLLGAGRRVPHRPVTGRRAGRLRPVDPVRDSPHPMLMLSLSAGALTGPCGLVRPASRLPLARWAAGAGRSPARRSSSPVRFPSQRQARVDGLVGPGRRGPRRARGRRRTARSVRRSGPAMTLR